MYRIFCATPWELEAERGEFYRVIGGFNETVAMPAGALYVPVSLTTVRDKRPLQYAIDENIRDSRHYLLVHNGSWGPLERNFLNDYRLALECQSDSSLPMRGVANLRRLPVQDPSPDMPVAEADFSTPAEFEQRLLETLSRWFSALK